MSDLAIFLWFYTFAAFGLCYVVGGSKLSLPLRNAWARWAGVVTLVNDVTDEAAQVLSASKPRWRALLLDLVECPACLGVWIGIVTGFVVGHVWFFTTAQAALFALALGCYTGGVNYLLGRLTGLLAEP